MQKDFHGFKEGEWVVTGGGSSSIVYVSGLAREAYPKEKGLDLDDGWVPVIDEDAAGGLNGYLPESLTRLRDLWPEDLENDCPLCETGQVMDGDYLCHECRFGL